MVYTHDYDSQYLHGPAMPIIELQIRRVGRKTSNSILTVIVDSGADATILPLRTLKEAQLKRVGQARMRWGPHTGELYDVNWATLVIGPMRFTECEFKRNQMVRDLCRNV